MTQATPRQHLAFGLAAAAALVWSGVEPHDRFVWILEVAPAPIAAAILAAAYPRWRLTPLVLGLVTVHAVILMVGGKYTYAHVPWFDLVRETFGGTRNNYDRVGHFAQGFVPALVAREILLRREVLVRGPWLFFVVTCTILAISAFYELIEWWVALASGQAAEDFLGTQGDVWDTQTDMFLALVGGVTAQLALGRWHDRLLGLRNLGAATLREITEANLDLVSDLRVAAGQKYHVASVAKTFRQAAGRDDAWLRAIYAGEEPVGLLALVDPSLAGRDATDIHLWRLLVDQRYQGNGYGAEAVRQAIAYARSRPGCRYLKLSQVPSNERVGRFYEAFGFRHSGAVDEDGELEMILELAGPAHNQ